MKLSIFTHMTNPEERMDPWKEALNCYRYFADEVVIVGKEWPYEFKWDLIGKTFQEGFDKSNGDWVINMPTDMFFHENSKDKLLSALDKFNDSPAICVPKFKFFNPYRYEFKNFEILIVNKKKFPNLKFDGGLDLCLPTINNKLINYKSIPIVNIPIWNYDTTFRTKEIIAEDRARFARAWFKQFNDWGDRGGSSSNEAFEAWFKMVESRLSRHLGKVDLQLHPKFIIEKLERLNKNQFGYDCFGLLDKTKPNLKTYANYLKLKIRFPNIKLI